MGLMMYIRIRMCHNQECPRTAFMRMRIILLARGPLRMQSSIGQKTTCSVYIRVYYRQCYIKCAASSSYSTDMAISFLQNEQKELLFRLYTTRIDIFCQGEEII